MLIRMWFRLRYRFFPGRWTAAEVAEINRRAVILKARIDELTD